jgi:hypothetical protein
LLSVNGIPKGTETKCANTMAFYEHCVKLGNEAVARQARMPSTVVRRGNRLVAASTVLMVNHRDCTRHRFVVVFVWERVWRPFDGCLIPRTCGAQDGSCCDTSIRATTWSYPTDDQSRTIPALRRHRYWGPMRWRRHRHAARPSRPTSACRRSGSLWNGHALHPRAHARWGAPTTSLGHSRGAQSGGNTHGPIHLIPLRR